MFVIFIVIYHVQAVLFHVKGIYCSFLSEMSRSKNYCFCLFVVNRQFIIKAPGV